MDENYDKGVKTMPGMQLTELLTARITVQNKYICYDQQYEHHECVPFAILKTTKNMYCNSRKKPGTQVIH